MNGFEKTAATVAALALMLPGTALASKGAPHGRSDKAGASVQASAPAASGKAGAPGQVCKSLKVKGKKTVEQRAAFKKCIHDAVAKRKADNAAKAKDDAEAEDDAQTGVTSSTAVAPAS